jgi:hypothetical protein
MDKKKDDYGTDFPEEVSLVSAPARKPKPVKDFPALEELPIPSEEDLLRAMGDVITDDAKLAELMTTYESLYPDTLWKAMQFLNTPGPNCKTVKKSSLGEWMVYEWGKR